MNPEVFKMLLGYHKQGRFTNEEFVKLCDSAGLFVVTNKSTIDKSLDKHFVKTPYINRVKYATLGDNDLRIYEVRETCYGSAESRVVFDRVVGIIENPNLKNWIHDSKNLYNHYKEIDLFKSEQAVYVLMRSRYFYCEETLEDLIMNNMELSISKKEKRRNDAESKTDY